MPQKDFWKEHAFVSIIAPPKVASVVRELAGENVTFSGCQPRTVPGPELDGGYCSWHRDCSAPWRDDEIVTNPGDRRPTTEPRLKCFLYLQDVEKDQGPTAVQRGSHRIPWAPDGMYDLAAAGYNGFCGAAGFAGTGGVVYNEATGYARQGLLVNNMVFAAKAGDMCIFDISTYALILLRFNVTSAAMKPIESLPYLYSLIADFIHLCRTLQLRHVKR